MQLVLVSVSALTAGLVVAGSVSVAAAGTTDDAITRLTEQVQLLQQEHAEQRDLLQVATNQLSQRRLQEESLSMQVDALRFCLDHMWLILCGTLVMLMQGGFAMLEAGSVRVKNVSTVMLKNLIDVAVGTIGWWLVGYGFAYGNPGDSANGFIGVTNFVNGDFFVADPATGAWTLTNHFRDWFFQWAFCATAATIVSGGVAERIQLGSYIIYSAIMTAIIYPVIVWWTWSGSGWTATAFGSDAAYSDFAGSGIVHLTGGVAALVGAIMCGPRKGRFDSSLPEFEFDPHSVPLVVLGTLLLWFGWYGFNCGSTLTFSDKDTARTAALVAVNSTLAAVGGGLAVLLLRFRTGRYDLTGMCNGILVGLVAICAGCNVCVPGVALLVGVAAGVAYECGHCLMLKLKIDDPLDAFSVHGLGGVTGALLRPLVDYNGANGAMFGCHCATVAAIVAWSGGISLVCFGILSKVGMLRLPDDVQDEGTDMKELSPRRSYSSEAVLDNETMEAIAKA